MTGEQLREKLINLDSSLAKIARKVGMTPQNLNVMLKTKDIKTGFIEKLARIYHKDITYFYSDSPSPSRAQGDSNLGDVPSNAQDSLTDGRYLRSLLEEKDKRIQLLEAIINSHKLI